MKKRILSLILCVSMLVGVLVGCGGSENKNTETEQNTEQGTEGASQESTEELIQESKSFIYKGIDIKLKVNTNMGYIATSGAYGGHDSHLIYQVIENHMYNDTNSEPEYTKLCYLDEFKSGKEWLQQYFYVSHDSFKLEVDRLSVAISNDNINYSIISSGDEITNIENLTAAQLFKVYVEGTSTETYVVMTYKYTDDWEMTGLYAPQYIYKYFPEHELVEKYQVLKNYEALTLDGDKYCLFTPRNGVFALAYLQNDEVTMIDNNGNEIVKIPNYENLMIYYTINYKVYISYTDENGSTIYAEWRGYWQERDKVPTSSDSAYLDVEAFYNNIDDALINPVY